MDHWNKGGLSREEFLRMRENALRQLQELARKQQALASAAGNSPQASDTISKKENMPLEQVPVQPVMQPEQIRPAERQKHDCRAMEGDWAKSGADAGSRRVGCFGAAKRRGFNTGERETCYAAGFRAIFSGAAGEKTTLADAPFPAGERGRN